MTSTISTAKNHVDHSSDCPCRHAVEEDNRLSIKALATAHGKFISMIHTMLHDDLGLEKKSARWVPKLLNDEQKQQSV